MTVASVILACVLVAFRSVLAQQSCECLGVYRGLQVCGTDGTTYPNPCALTNAQKANMGLGMKCLGPCPCTAALPAVSRVCTAFGFWSNKPTTVAPTTLPTPPPVQPFRFPRHSHQWQGHHGHGGRHSDSSSEENRPGQSRPQLPWLAICLTNGTTVYDPVAAHCAVANPANPSLAIRCYGTCARCASRPNCPGVTVSGSTTPAPGAPITPTTTAAPGVTVTTPEPIPDFLQLSQKVFQNKAFLT